MTKDILPQYESEQVDLIVTACPVCKGTCRLSKTFCFKCNGRGILMRPALVVQPGGK